MRTAYRARQAYQGYWRLLTYPGRWSLILQAVLLIAPLLTVHTPLLTEDARWLIEQSLKSLGVVDAIQREHLSDQLRELADLAKFQLIWCAWCEQLYCLRRSFQPSHTISGSPARRLVLDLYGGFLFMTVLSLLTSVNPLLGVGAMFLLFTSVEALDVSLKNRSTLGALAGGLERSFRMISAEPWRFLGRLLLPGLVLYASGVVVVTLRQWAEQEGNVALRSFGWLLTGTALLLWLAFFALAQLRIQMRAMAIDLDDVPAGAGLAVGSAQTQPRPRPRILKRLRQLVTGGGMTAVSAQTKPTPQVRNLKRLRQLVTDFEGVCSGMATAIGILITLWTVYQLGRNGLFTLPALVLAFQAAVTLVTSTVQVFLDLLMKVGFLTLVLGAVICGVVVVIGIGRRRLRILLQEMAKTLRSGIGSFGDFLAKDLKLSSATLGIGTLLTALGTVAMQTYARVQEGQLQQRQQEQAQEVRRQEEQVVSQEHNARLDGLEKALNARLASYMSDYSGNHTRDDDQRALDKRALIVSELRELLNQLRRPDGAEDADRKGKLLRSLYESGLLLSVEETCNIQASKQAKLLKNALNSGLSSMAQRDAEKLIRPTRCLPRIFLDSMDFTGANLAGAYLAKAFLPYITLRNANLSGANLAEANLSHAQLENADLSGADLNGSILNGANVVGANLKGVSISCDTKVDNLVAFFAHFSPVPMEDVNPTSQSKKCPPRGLVISWEKVVTGEKRDDLLSDGWSFCPLDQEPEQAMRNSPPKVQAGAKCENRRFIGGETLGNGTRTHPREYSHQNWSGGLFNKSRFESLTIKNVQLVGAHLGETQFVNVRLRNVTLWGADLKRAVITDSSLENVDFTGADLSGLRFERVRARNVQFRGVLLDKSLNLGSFNEAQLHRVALTREEFEKRIQDQPATFLQDLIAPVLFAPLPLRPLHLLYWMVTG